MAAISSERRSQLHSPELKYCGGCSSCLLARNAAEYRTAACLATWYGF